MSHLRGQPLGCVERQIVPRIRVLHQRYAPMPRQCFAAARRHQPVAVGADHQDGYVWCSLRRTVACGCKQLVDCTGTRHWVTLA